MRSEYLSYRLDGYIPVYGNARERLNVKRIKYLARGDSCNTFIFEMGNHWGTHIDAPGHFFSGAQVIADYPAHELIFKHPCIVNIRLKKDMIIGVGDIKDKVDKRHDIVLLKTGFGRFRGSKKYSVESPLVSAQIGLWLRAERKNVRAVGLDFVSLSSLRDRAMGRSAHRAFLNPEGKGRPVLIIEDMNLNANLGGLKAVWVAPLLVKGIDSAPCTVLGLFR